MYAILMIMLLNLIGGIILKSLSIPVIAFADLPLDLAALFPEGNFFSAHSRDLGDLQPQLVLLVANSPQDLEEVLDTLEKLAIPALVICRAGEVESPIAVTVMSPFTRQTVFSALAALASKTADSISYFTQLVNSLEDLVFTLDGELRHTGVYGRWLAQVPGGQAAFLGRTAKEVLGDKDGDFHEEAARKALQGETVEYQWAAKGKGRKLIWYQTRVSSLTDGLGRIQGVVGIGREITQLRDTKDKLAKSMRQVDRLAKDLEKATQVANRADRAKTEFMAAVSQEFRVHLNQVVGIGDLLAEANLNDNQRLYAEMLSNSVTSLVKLNNDIHHMSRLEMGSRALSMEEFSLAEILEQVKGLLAPKLSQAGLQLNLHLGGDVPCQLSGDVDCLKQTLMNLLSEALSVQGITIISMEVTRIPTPVEGTVTLLFAIKGDGVDTRESDGLNLALARRTVELLGGNLWIETAQNGWVYNVALQFNLSLREQVRENPAQSQRALSVLLVEDFADNVTLIRAFIANSGHLLETAEDGRAGVEKFKQGHYDVVLMDMQMPIMDGFTATREIRRYEETLGLNPVPIIALTAYAFPEDVTRALKAGCNAHLAKPVTKSALLAAINNWISAN
jgi:CheY-like chemotaxis protein/PAS domain-containing protein